MPRTSQISLDPTRETAFAAFSCGTSNVNVLGMEDFMGDELKAFSLHMGRAKCAVDLGDGSWLEQKNYAPYKKYRMQKRRLIMPVWAIVVLIILAVLLVAFIALAIYANKLQKKSEASQEQIRAGAQTYSILVIDKKRMKLKDFTLSDVRPIVGYGREKSIASPEI